MNLDGFRNALSERRPLVEPDPGFASRVTAALPERRTDEVVGWAAARLLPVTAALLLVLSWFALSPADSSSAGLTNDAADDIVSWVLVADQP